MSEWLKLTENINFLGTKMAEYEDCEVKYDHNYETVYTNSNITKETFSSRNLWIKIVILVMTVSLVCSVLGVTITYLVMRGKSPFNRIFYFGCLREQPLNLKGRGYVFIMSELFNF